MADNEKIRADIERKAKSKAKRKVKKKVKRIHPATIFICLLCLALGVAAGAGAYGFITKDDCFKLKGNKEYSIPLGSEFTYTDAGVEVISFGQDISDKVKIETNLTELGNGKYTADTSEAGEYYIIYTVDSIKYGEMMRVRVITVEGGEE